MTYFKVWWCTPNWVGIDQPMQMRQTSRAQDKKLVVNNYWLIIDEFRLVSKDVIDKILSPTEISRQCPYLKFKEYEHLREEPREIYLSSAYYKSSWMWDEIRLAVSKFYNKGIE